MFLKKSYNKELILKVRQKWYIVPGTNPNIFRKDQCGAWIKFNEYWNRNSQNWWEIDHITPVSHGGSDSLYNLRPLQWENNLSKSNGRLVCRVHAI